jgi:Protein of unknown function (DUF3297)
VTPSSPRRRPCPTASPPIPAARTTSRPCSSIRSASASTARNVEEYCVSEGWVKVPAGKTVDRKGRPMLIKLKGEVEPFYR